MMGGGMGGGLMGILMKGVTGGMNRDPSAVQPPAAEPVADDYDVSRWKRADGLDAPTMVQTVRADWDKRSAERQEGSPLKKLFGKLTRKKEAKASDAAAEPESRPAGGTVVTPEMKKTSQRINPSAEQEEAAQPAPLRGSECAVRGGKNYLGLSFQTELGGFFTSNPVNSAILAVDTLGMGVLAFNQVVPAPEAEAAPEPRPAAEPAEIPGQAPAGGLQNLIAQRADTNYMNEFHKSREMQKYNVRILK